MKKNNSFAILFLWMLIGYCGISCSDEREEWTPDTSSEGALMEIYAGLGMETRVSELPSVDSINYLGESGLQHVGLYIYYSDHYEQDDLSEPYIRNLECEIVDGKLVPVTQPGDPDSYKNIFIYDRMTIVAFYPYNPDVPDFTVKADENQYPVTKLNYSEQTYIPYRGETTANPTNAYYVSLTLYPKHTFKMEIILVSENESDFNDGNPDIKVLPALDPADNTNPAIGTRAKWVDRIIPQPNTGGGMHVRKYITYLWRTDELNLVIDRNEVLFENEDFTLLATERINTVERRVYRYGYNMTTGESFIPTSETLINDAASLQGVNNLASSAVYQVCDIDLAAAGAFTPLSILNSTYDGGGHSIRNLNVTAPRGNEAGLFGQIVGNSIVKEVNLIDPVINVSVSTDTCYVGALCGRVNNILSDDELEALYANISLPPNLSQVVKDAILGELLGQITNTTSQIIACRVENPTITVTGTHARVGAVCGIVGEKPNGDDFYGYVWDTYSLGGSISVNAGNPAANAGSLVGGFCGVNEYYITRCFTTMEAAGITATGYETQDINGTPTQVEVDIWEGFANQGTQFPSGSAIVDCFAVAPDSNSGVSPMNAGSWPSGWVNYTGIWPINVISWTDYSSNSYWYNLGTPGTTDYPTLHWERR